jgi:glycosyl transferase family 25
MNRQLIELGIEHEFFSAVDGRKLSQGQMEKMCNMEVVRQWPGLFTPGAIGCSLSHYNIYLKMVNEGIDMAFILEDDIRLSRSIPLIIKQIECSFNSGHINRNEVILLYYQSKEEVEFSKMDSFKLYSKTGLYYPLEIWRPITTAAYVISLENARRLVNLIYPIKYPSDSWAVYHREGAIAGLRCVLPLPVESGFFRSNIGYEQDKKLNRVVKYFESIGLFPFPQLLKLRRLQRARRQNRFVIKNEPPRWEVKVIPAVS